MIKKAISTYLILVMMFCLPLDAEEVQQISVAVAVGDGAHRALLKIMMEKYNRDNPSVDINFIFSRDVSNYNNSVRNWVEQGRGPDVIFWLGGRRIEHFSSRGLLHDLTEFWESRQLDEAFPPALRNPVTIGSRKYGIPITYYLYTLYYSKPAFKRYGINVPETWSEVLRACRYLRKKDIDLFSVGTGETPWSLHAWYDYLSLRIHGLEKYQKLLNGEISYTDNRIKEVLRHWRQLLDNGCMNENHRRYNTWDAFPRILHNFSAMILTDGIPQGVTESAREGLYSAVFPTIKPGIPKYTVAPVNAFIVPAYVSMTPKLESFLEYLSAEEFQHKFNKPIFRPPGNVKAVHNLDRNTREMAKMITESPGGIQFLDRDTDIRFAERVPRILLDFMSHKDVDRTSEELEENRLKVFGKLKKEN